MNSRRLAITLLTALAMTVQVSAHAGEIRFTPLNDPNQGPGGALGNAINDLGVVGGGYAGTNGVFYGFVSTPPYSNKSFTTVEVPGTPPVANVWGINLEGTATGHYFDANNVAHGFVTHPPYSTVITLDAPGACSVGTACGGSGTWAYSINLEGAIAGYYVDANGIYHGFVTHPPYTESTFTTIDATGACSSGAACSGLGTVIQYFALNDLGAVTGYFYDASSENVEHGFVSYPPYTRFTTFDAPGACSSDTNPTCAFIGTMPESINDFGVITGSYWDPEDLIHGFVSYPPYTKTTFTSFDGAGALYSFPSSINAEGVLTGFFYDASGVAHGLVSHPPYTTVTTFDAPGACSSDTNPACQGYGTFAYGINLEGAFTGYADNPIGTTRLGFVAREGAHW